MNKIKKITAVLLLVVLLLLLCSCGALDELKANRAFFNENGVIYNNTLYKLVNVANAENIEYNCGNRQYINVSDPDVPVLASVLFSLEYSINGDKTIIDAYEDGLYVREDKYDMFMDGLKNGVNYTYLGFDYYDFDLENEIDYILSENEKQAVLSLLSTESVEPEFYDYYYDELYLFEQSDNALFRKSDVYSIVRYEGPGEDDSYCLVVYDNDEEYTWEVSAVYKSTPQTDSLFKSYFEKEDIDYYY